MTDALEQVPRRLDKLLRDFTRWPRNELLRAIEDDRVSVRVDGVDVPSDPAALVFGGDEVRLDGVVVRPAKHQSVVFNKPKGVTCTLSDPGGRRDLSGYVRSMPEGCFPVGRLDRTTTGAMLFTTDGDLANAMLQPDRHMPKVYVLTVEGPVRESDPRLTSFRQGVQTTLGFLRAESVVVASIDDQTQLVVTLLMGKNRQLHRMCRAVGLRLTHLHRRSIGPLSVDELAPGEWSLLSEADVERLWHVVGGRQRSRTHKVAGLHRLAASARSEGAPNRRLERWLELHTQSELSREGRGPGDRSL